MVRKGRFAVWNEKEYALVSQRRQYYLQTEDEQEKKNGFEIMNEKTDVFVRPVSVQELDDAYEIIPYAMVEGYRFAVEGMDHSSGKIALVTNNPFVKEKIDVRQYGQHEFILELPKEQVELLEDRIPILGFETKSR